MAQIVRAWFSEARARVEAIIADRNRAQEHVARAQACLPAGRSIRRLTLEGAPDSKGPHGTAVMPAQFAALGANPIEWCCLDATAMPAAAP